MQVITSYNKLAIHFIEEMKSAKIAGRITYKNRLIIFTIMVSTTLITIIVTTGK